MPQRGAIRQADRTVSHPSRQIRSADAALALAAAPGAGIHLPLRPPQPPCPDAGPLAAGTRHRSLVGKERIELTTANAAAADAGYAASLETALWKTAGSPAGRRAKASTSRTLPRLRGRCDLPRNQSRHSQGLAEKWMRGLATANARLLRGFALSCGRRRTGSCVCRGQSASVRAYERGVEIAGCGCGERGGLRGDAQGLRALDATLGIGRGRDRLREQSAGCQRIPDETWPSQAHSFAQNEGNLSRCVPPVPRATD